MIDPRPDMCEKEMAGLMRKHHPATKAANMGRAALGNAYIAFPPSKINLPNMRLMRFAMSWGKIVPSKKKQKARRRASANSLRKRAHVTLRQKNYAAFYRSMEWKRARYDILKANNGRCQLCGIDTSTGAVLNVDHIKPVREFPKLALDPDNLQVLCGNCNAGKGNRDDTDWRKAAMSEDGSAERFEFAVRQLRSILDDF